MARYLPGGGGHVVITSRNPSWQELAIPVGVDVLDRDESIMLLCHRASQLTTDDARRIAQALGDLPLALTEAGAYLAETGMSVQDYLTLLAERTTELMAQEAPAAYSASLAASTQITLERLGVQSPAALQLLTLAAYLAPEPISTTLFTTHSALLPEPLATVAKDPLAFTTLTRLLRQHGLTGVDPATLTLHRLLAAIVRDLPQLRQDLPIRAVRLVRAAVLREDPWENPPAWPTWHQLLPHILIATDPHRTLAGVEADIAWLLHRAARYLHTLGEPAAAQPLFQRAWDLHCGELGTDHPDTLASAGGVAHNMWALGQFEQARRLGEDTLVRCRQVLGDDHPQTLVVASTLASALRDLGHYKAARQLAEDILLRSRRVLGEDPPIPSERLTGSFSSCESWHSMSRRANSAKTPSPAASGSRVRTILTRCAVPTSSRLS